MRIEDLLSLDHDSWHLPKPDVDALTGEDALQDAQVLDVRLNALTGVAGVLFELRQSLHIEGADTGVLVCFGTRDLAWSGAARPTELTAWSVGGSVPSTRGTLFSITMSMWPEPGASLSLTAVSAAFIVGQVPGLASAPPDYTAHDRTTIAADIATWSSTFEPTGANVFDSVAP